MKLTTKIPLLILLLGFLSCTKGGGNIYVEGRVYNPVTGEGIPDVKINLTKAKVGGAPASQSGGYKTVKSVTTNAEGYYEITHSTILLQDYYIRVEEPADYYSLGFIDGEGNYQNGSLFKVNKSKNTYVGYEAISFAKIKYIISNNNCTGSTDKLVLYEESLSASEYFIDAGWQHDGCVNFESDYLGVPMGRLALRWEVTKNITTTTYHDTIYLEEGEQRVYEINY